PLSQSPGTRHSSPGTHGEHVGPPQSMSVSPRLSTPSMQLAPTQAPASQTSLWQSASMMQPPPSGQGLHTAPPQSTSVSSWFTTRSSQVGDAHVLVPGAHTPDSQSEPLSHPSPSAHGSQSMPPQSTAVSSPLS